MQEEEEEESEQEKEIMDDFLDKDFDVAKEINKAIIASRRTNINTVEWSGEDVICKMEPNKAKRITNDLSSCRIWPQGTFGYWKRFNTMCVDLVESALFENFLTICVAINTFVLSMDRYNIPSDEDKLYAQMNEVFTWIFIVEFGIKLFSIGPINYLRDIMNYIDGSVVMLSIVEMTLLSDTEGASGAFSAFRAVRIFRTFRVLRVARLLKSM